MRVCLISPAVYQGDQEFNTVKFPADKTLFGEAEANECCNGTEEAGGGRSSLITHLMRSFHPLSHHSSLLQQMRKLDLDGHFHFFILLFYGEVTLSPPAALTSGGDKPVQHQDLGRSQCLPLSRLQGQFMCLAAAAMIMGLSCRSRPGVLFYHSLFISVVKSD